MGFNTFNKQRTTGEFVYALMDNNIIFYVGITSNLGYRYKQHFADWLICGEYIYKMRMVGKYPEVLVLGIYDSVYEAEAAEHTAIRLLSSLGIKLCNHHQNPHHNYIERDRIGIAEIKVKRMPQKLFKLLINTAIEEYNKFRKWETRPITSSR